MNQATQEATVADLPRPQVVVPHPLDATDIAQFYATETVGKPEQTRMAKLIQRFKVTDQASLKAAVKDYVERETKRGEKEKLIARVHGSEIKTLFGYACTLNKSLEGMGYKTALDTARTALKVAMIRWDGSRILEKEEREAKQQAKQVGAVAEAEYIQLADFRRKNGRDATPEERQKIRDEIAGKLQRSAQIEMAAALVKKHGGEWAADLVDCLTAEILRVEHEAAEKVAAVATGTEG